MTINAGMELRALWMVLRQREIKIRVLSHDMGDRLETPYENNCVCGLGTCLHTYKRSACTVTALSALVQKYNKVRFIII